jgi:hypothetical protein
MAHQEYLADGVADRARAGGTICQVVRRSRASSGLHQARTAHLDIDAQARALMPEDWGGAAQCWLTTVRLAG